jgi:hypothetical protein
MTMRKGLGRGMGCGYKNLAAQDPMVHRMSAKGMKQPQAVPMRSSPLAREYGLDLTDFGSVAAFKKVLKENNLPMTAKKIPHYWKGIDGKRQVYYSYEFKNDEVTLRTGNDPITGKYSQPSGREMEKGYASYIGIRGYTTSVMKLVESIKKHATYIKGENENELEFIW